MNKHSASISKRWVLPLGVLWSLCSLSLAEPDKPNILFVFSDDHSPNAIGAYDGWL